jgi:hypothetical protein
MMIRRLNPQGGIDGTILSASYVPINLRIVQPILIYGPESSLTQLSDDFSKKKPFMLLSFCSCVNLNTWSNSWAMR